MLTTTKPKPPSIKPVTFYGGSLPRPRVYVMLCKKTGLPLVNDGPKRLNTERVDAPPSMNYYLCKWAKDATWQMGGVSDKPKPLQGKIVSRMNVLAKAEARENKKKLREIRKRKLELRMKEGKHPFEESELEESDVEDSKDFLKEFEQNEADSGAEESDDEMQAENEDGEEKDEAQDNDGDTEEQKEKPSKKAGAAEATEVLPALHIKQVETRGQKEKRMAISETPVISKRPRRDVMSTGMSSGMNTGGSEKASAPSKLRAPKKVVNSTQIRVKKETAKRKKAAAMTSRRSLRLTLTPHDMSD